MPFEQREWKNPDVLSCEEILYWIKELSRNPLYGWSRNKSNLARALGFRKHALECMNSKTYGAWIWPSEQVRISERIKLILAGHVIPKYNCYPHSFEYVNPPRPPAKPPAKLRVATHPDGPMLHVEPFQPPVRKLPDFKNVFKNARLWKTD